MEAIKKPAGAGYILFDTAYIANGGDLHHDISNNKTNQEKVKSCHGLTSYFVSFTSSTNTANIKSGIIRNITRSPPRNIRHAAGY
jgi:hypothetical protein